MPDRPPEKRPDLFDTMTTESVESLGHVKINSDLKEAIVELVGMAVKEGMRLREGYPVRLMAPRLNGAMPAMGEGGVLDQYMIETTDLIEAYADKIAQLFEGYMNDELAETLAMHATARDVQKS